MKRLLTFLGSCFCLVSGSGCDRDTLVTRNSVAGEWTETSQHRPIGIIKFNDNGSFSAVNVPKTIVMADQSGHPERISANGKWTIVKRSGREVVEVTWPSSASSPIGFSNIGYLENNNKRLELCFDLGDPDLRKRIIFRKTE